MGVVHAHSRVVIDCRVPQESVIRIVSIMGTKKSISYKMISHGSWYRQIENGRGRNHSRKRDRQRISMCKYHTVEERENRKGEKENEYVEGRGRYKHN